jgi:hypothetical protein
MQIRQSDYTVHTSIYKYIYIYIYNTRMHSSRGFFSHLIHSHPIMGACAGFRICDIFVYVPACVYLHTTHALLYDNNKNEPINRVRDRDTSRVSH